MLQTAMMWLKSKKGQGLVEYVLILSLIAVATIAAMTALATNISDVFVSIGTAIT